MRCSDCSSEVKPIVALDIDGTLGEYHNHLLLFMRRYFNRDLQGGWTGSPEDWEEYLGLTREEYREAKLAFRQGGMKRTMPLIPGAAQLVGEVHARGAELWITTTRPWMRLDSVDPDTRHWLERQGLKYDHLLYDEHKYAKLAEIVDPDRVVFILDDLAEMVEEALNYFQFTTPYLLRRTHNLADQRVPARRIVQNLKDAQDKMIYNINEWSKKHG